MADAPGQHPETRQPHRAGLFAGPGALHRPLCAVPRMCRAAPMSCWGRALPGPAGRTCAAARRPRPCATSPPTKPDFPSPTSRLTLSPPPAASCGFGTLRSSSAAAPRGWPRAACWWSAERQPVSTVRDRLCIHSRGGAPVPAAVRARRGQPGQQHQGAGRASMHGLVPAALWFAFYVEDLLYLPLAVLLWPWQWLQLRRLCEQHRPRPPRGAFGFRSLLHRHYVFVGEKPAE
ncbi:MAG: hypothetical protein WKG07_15835 [Hymenobacter sp.]